MKCLSVFCPGREVPELWEVESITPLFNQTIVEGPHRGWLKIHTAVKPTVNWFRSSITSQVLLWCVIICTLEQTSHFQ